MARFLHAGITDQIKAALRRKADAEVLRFQQHWRGAMYLLGYAIECRIKAKLLEMYGAHTLSDLERTLSRRRAQEVNLRTHSIEYLFEFTNARIRLIGPDGNDEYLRAFQRCNTWTVTWRYHPQEASEADCQRFFEAAGKFLRFLSVSV